MIDPSRERDLSADNDTEEEVLDGRDRDPGAGFVEIRRALVGLGFIWLTASAAFGAILSAVYGFTVSSGYLLVSVVAGAVAVVAAFASLRAFGYR